MASHGAKHIILASRSGSSKEEVKALLETLRGQGIDIVALRCDVSQYSDVEKLVSFASANMPPIRGLIHGGMVLRVSLQSVEILIIVLTQQDTLFGRMQFQDWLEVLAPKVQGTWNLHNLLPQKNMDFFIMLSSIVGVRGNASQGAYSAAGAFLDAFAHYRRSLGLPAVSIDLGKIDEIGFVAESNEQTSKRLDEFGVSAMNERQYLALLKVAMEQDPSQIITGFTPYSPDHALPEYQVNTFAFFRRAGEATKQSASDDGSGPTRVRGALRLATSLEEATTAFCTAFVQKMSVLLMVAAENIDFSKSINDYGMDSLVAVEMRNWLFKEMDITIPILELLANQSLSKLSGKLVKKSNLTTSLFPNGDLVHGVGSFSPGASST
jgi:NAD(P)-dependent dehydrogenase (short-subunit alcohol dehydrogenase family)/acyl carrier protein